MGLENEFLIGELIKNGSKSIKSRNENGQHTYYANDDTDGVSSANIAMPNYNEDELVKAVDTEVDELIILDENGGIILSQEAYDRLVAQRDDLQTELTQIQSESDDLTGLVADLEIQIAELTALLDVERNINASLESQLDTLGDRINELSQDYQSTLLKGIDESILRVSLEAQIAGIQAQLEQLQQRFANQATLPADAVFTSDFAVRAITSGVSNAVNVTVPNLIGADKDEAVKLNNPIFYYYWEKVNDTVKEQGFFKGNSLEITNISEKKIKIEFDFESNNPNSTIWLDVNDISLDIEPFSQIIIPLSVETNVMDAVNVGGLFNTGIKLFDYLLKIRSIGGGSVNLKTTLLKRRG